MRVKTLAMATAIAITQTGPNKSSPPALLNKDTHQKRKGEL